MKYDEAHLSCIGFSRCVGIYFQALGHGEVCQYKSRIKRRRGILSLSCFYKFKHAKRCLYSGRGGGIYKRMQIMAILNSTKPKKHRGRCSCIIVINQCCLHSVKFFFQLRVVVKHLTSRESTAVAS